MPIKENVDVSIIVLLYNADWVKLERTIQSVINQQGINFEVVLSDDGSQNNPDDMVASVMDKYQYTNYKFNRNEKNVGTVKNILSALEYASGKYIYLISPGDMIFDENTMKDFFEFAERNQSMVCFGDYIPYNVLSGRVQTFEGFSHPPAPSVYEHPHSFFESKVYTLFGGNILGPTFFRKKEYATRYFSLASQSSKYVEDNTSIVFSLAENIPIHHCNRHICWYEQGTGISTGGNGEWQKLLEKDFDNTYTYAKRMYPKDKVVDAAYLRRTKSIKNRWCAKLCIGIKHPWISFTYRKGLKIPKAYIKCNAAQAEILKERLKGETGLSFH